MPKRIYNKADEASQKLTDTEVTEAYSAIRLAINRYSGLLSRYRLSDEDVEHECMLKIIRHRHTFKGESKFTTWVFRASINTILNLTAACKRVKNGVTDALSYDETDNPVVVDVSNHALNNVLLNEQYEILAKMTEKLPRSLQEVVRLMVEGYDYKEIAKMLDIPRGTVQSRMHTIRKALQTMAKIEYNL
jgi:RNA polymerase sigma-70 factor (ECF subfamily)